MKIKGRYLLIFSLFNCAVALADTEDAEHCLEQFIDSIYQTNQIDYQVVETEFLAYCKKNYRSFESIEGTVSYFNADKRGKRKQLMLAKFAILRP